MKELCVRCGKETKYDTGTPITLRRYFIEGAGQLCEECFSQLYGLPAAFVSYNMTENGEEIVRGKILGGGYE